MLKMVNDETTDIWLKVTHPTILYNSVKTLSFSVVFTTSFQLILCFVLLGICASDHLCPSVSYLSRSKTNSRNVIASVLLAWCNSSPDLFSNFVSWINSESPAILSIGEVLGSCGIIICIIIGLLFYFMEEKLTLMSFQVSSLIMDLFFVFLVSLCLLWMILLKSVVWYLSLTMVAIYIVYVIFKIRLHRDTMKLGEGGDKLIGDIERNLENDCTIRPTLLESLDFNVLIQMLGNNEYETEMELFYNSSKSLEQEPASLQRPLSEPVITKQRQNFLSGIKSAVSTAPSLFNFQLYHENSIQNHDSDIDFDIKTSSNKRKPNKSLFFQFFPNLLNWEEKCIGSKVISILLSPWVALLNICVPVYDETSENRYNEKMLILQSIFSPFFTMAIIVALYAERVSLWFWIIPGFVCSSLTLISITLAKDITFLRKLSLFLSQASGSTYNLPIKVISLIGILNSVLCISLLANILVEIIELYQRITQISQSLLAITIFAWGNSISDLMSNLAMSQLYNKLSTMESERSFFATRFMSIALSACLGGVLLNVSVGIGLSSLIAMLFRLKCTSISFGESVSAQFLLTTSMIMFSILAMLATLVYSPSLLQDNTRFIGILLCCFWTIAILLDVILEIVT